MYLIFYNYKSPDKAYAQINRIWTTGGGDELHVQFGRNTPNYFLPYNADKGRFLVKGVWYDAIEVSASLTLPDPDLHRLDIEQLKQNWFSPNL